MSPLRLAATTLALALLLPALPATAQEVRCVRSVAEFNSAWVLGQDEPVVIRLATGTYDLAGSVLDFDSGQFAATDEDMQILGGYNSNCSARVADPGATVITHGSGGELRFRTVQEEAGAGNLLLERMTLRGIGLVRIQLEDAISNDAGITIDRVWIDQVGRINLDTGAEFVMRNSVVSRGGSCALRLAHRNYASGNPGPAYFERAVISHSTFASNAGPGLCIGRVDFDEDDWRLDLTSSVFWGNGAIDIQLDNPGVNTIDAVLRHNTYTALQSNRALRTAPVATSTANPLFVNAASGNFRLSSASPAINTARTNALLAAQVDFDGNPRWFGDAPDRGAFETNIGSTNPVLTVTNTNDSGAGSLRQALIDANAASNLNTIRFNIAGACPRVITLASLLPDIIHPVVIEGYSQPGASRNSAVSGWNATLCIVLEGNNQISGAFGFNVNTSASPDATVSIEGIAFSGHSFAAAQFVGGRDHRFVGNQIGGVASSRTLLASGTGVRIGSEVEGVRVGGPDPAERNVIASALGAGISISGGSGSVQPTRSLIQNNYIGTQSGGDLRGNERGIFVSGPDHLLRDNVIANSLSHGIELSGALATGNRILDNRIGIPALCFGACVDRGNQGHGVLIRNSANNNRVDGNQIAFNDLDGIAVTGARRNTLRRNTMYDQGGIGIDLGDDGRNLADANNSVAAPVAAGNDSQNYPSISNVSGTPSVGAVTGTLNSANGWYRLDFYGIPESTGCTLVFSNGLPSGFFGEGRDWLGSTFVQISNATVGANGSVSFSEVPIQRAGSSSYFVAATTWVVATATRLSGPPLIGTYTHLGTSEFGRCRQYASGPGPDRMFDDGFEAGGSP